MATVREMRALFTAQAKGLRSTVKNITKDLTALEKYTGTAAKAFDKTNKSARVVEKTFKNADGTTRKMTARFTSLNKQMKATEGQSFKVANRLKDIGVSANVNSKAIEGMGVVAKRQFGRIAKDTNDVAKVNNQYVKSTQKGFESIGLSSMTLTNRLNEVGVGTGFVSRNFIDMEKQAVKAVKNTTKQFSFAGNGIASVSGASLTLRNRLAEVGTGTGTVAKNFVTLDKQAVQALNNTTKGVDRTRGAVSTFRTNVQNSFGSFRKGFQDLGQGFGQVSLNASRAGTSVANVVRNSMIAPFREATTVVKGYAAVLGLLSTGALAGSGMKRLSAIENANVSLEVMMGNADEASEFLDEVLDFAKTTPFAFPDLAETARNLVAFGMDKNKVVPTMQAIGDAAAGSGKGAEGLNQIAGAFGDMQVSGTLSMDQINRLASAGVPALKILANTMNKSVDDMKKDISSGTMSSVEAIDTLVKGMQEGTDGVAGATASMGGLMERMKDTWVGSVDSMKSSISSNMAKWMSPLKQPIQDFMGWFGSAFGTMTDTSLAFFASMGPAAAPLRQAFSNIRDFIRDSFMPAIKDIYSALQPVLALIGTGLVQAFTALSAVMKDVVGPIITMITNMKGFDVILAGLVGALVTYRVTLLSVIAVQKTKAIVTGAMTAATQLYFATVSAGSKVMTLFRALILGQAAAQRALNAAMFANPIGIIIAVLGGLAFAFYTAYQKSETFRNAVNALWANIVEGAKAVGQWLQTAWAEIVEFFTGAGTHSAQNYGKKLIEGLSNLWASIRDTSVRLASAVSEGFMNGLSATGEKIRSVFGDKVFGGISNLVKGFVDQFKTAFSSIDGAITMFLPTVTALATRFVGLTGPVGWIVTGLVSLGSYLYRLSKTNSEVGDAIRRVWNAIKGAFGAVLSALQPVFDGFQKIAKRLAKELGPEFEKTIVTIVDSFAELKPVLKEVGQTFGELVSVFADMFKELKVVVADAFKEVAATFKIIIPQILPVLKQLGAAWLEIQKTIWSAVGEVVKKILPLLATVVKQIVPIVVDLFKQLIPPILNLAKMVIPILLDTVKKVFPLILSVINTVLPVVTKLITTVITVVLDLVKNVLPLILKVVNQVFPLVLKIVEKVIPILIKVLTTLIKLVLAVLVPAIEMILKVVQVVFPVIAKVIESALNIVIGILDFFIALFTGNWKGMFEAVKKIISNAFKIIWSVIKGAFDVIVVIFKSTYEFIKSATSAAFTWVWNKIKSIWSSIYTTLSGWLTSILNKIKQVYNNAKNTTVSVFTAIWNFYKSIWSKIFGTLRDWVVAIWNRIRDTWNNIRNRTSEIFSAIRTTLSTIWRLIFNNVKDRVVSIWNRIRDTWNTVKNRTTEIFTTIFNKIRDTFNDIVDLAKSLPQKIGDGIKKMAGKVSDGLKAVSDKMIDGLAVGVNGVIKGVNWVLDKVGVDSKLAEWKPNKSSGGGGGQSRTASGGNKAIHAYKDGTDGHPGGPAIVGDGGMHELISFPNGRFAMSPNTDTLVNLPRGTGVMSGPDTQSFMNSIPLYKDGIFSKGLKMVKGAGKAVGKGVSALKDKAKDIWDWAAGGAKGLMDKVLKTMGVTAPNMAGGFGQVARGAFGFVKNKVVDYVGGMLPSFGDGGGADFPAPFRMTSKFNPARKHPKTGKIQPHNGIDFAAPMGTPIPAQAGGTVSYSGRMGGYGNIVIVKSGGKEYRYAHNSKNGVAVGQSVKKGQTVGLVGSTGDSTGPHVHYEVRVGGKAIDPLGAGGFGGKSGASGMVKTWITQAMNATGVPKSWLEPLATIAQKESGGNPRAINNWDINAKRGTPSMGLMQTIQPTFNAYKKKGMDAIMNPVHNAVAAINYIKSRYGTVFNTPGIKSMASGGPYRGYADGGIVDMAQLAWIAEGGWAESIISHDPSKRARSKAIWKETGDNLGFTKEVANLPPIEVNIAGMPILLDGKVISQAVFKHIDAATGMKTNKNAYMRGDRR